MPERDLQKIVNGCERFLGYGKARSVRQMMDAISESPLSLVRNDNYGQGGVLTDFEHEVAELLGKEAGAFMPSGTMAQQIALRIWSDRSGKKRVAFHPTCHLEMHEHRAYRELHGLEGILIGEKDQLFTLADLNRVEDPVSSLLIELPQRWLGGQLPTWKDLSAICGEAHDRGMKVHLDGARLWECAPYYQKSYAEICGLFDSVYVSFYKVLGGLPGALLAGPADFIEETRIWQRRHGGNLQQQSPSVISAKLGMAQHLPRIADYVAKAAEIAEILGSFDQIQVIPEHPLTNMMHLVFQGDREKLINAALQIAEEDKVGLFFSLSPDGRMELSVAENAQELDRDEIFSLFEKLFHLSQ